MSDKIKPKFQVCWGMKSHHHNAFESIEFHPALFHKKKEAKKFLRDSKSASSSGVTYFILKAY